LAATLARAGFSYVLVRNDLPKTSNDPPPSTDEVHTALAFSGLRRVASFGPLVTGRQSGIQLFLHTPAAPTRYPSLEIFALPKPASRIDSYPADSLAVVSGGPEALPLLADTSVLGNRPTVLATDIAAGVEPPGLKPRTWLDTDTLLREDQQYGSIHAGNSYLLAAGQNAAGESAPPQVRLDVNAAGHQTVAVYQGIKSVTASHYGFVLGTMPSNGPPSAVDGDPSTSWSVSGYPKNNVGQWLQLSLRKAVSTPYISIQILAEAKKRVRITSLRVTTDSGSRVVPVRNTEAAQRIELPPGPTKTLRLTILSVAGGGRAAQRGLYGPGIREVVVPGITISRTVALPNDATAYFPPGGADSISYLFSRDRSDPQSYFDLDAERQISREFTVPRAASFIASGTAVASNPLPPAAGKDSTVSLACGAGPMVQIDNKKYATYIRGSRSALNAGQPVSLGLCTLLPIKLAAGTHIVKTLPSSSRDASPSVQIATLSLTTGSTRPEPSRPVTVASWGDESRKVRVAAGAATILTIHENFNKSWKATADGKQLSAIRVDGWQQGFIVPAGGATVVHLVNGAGETYRLALVISACLVLLLLMAAAWPGKSRSLIRPPREWSISVVRVAGLLTAIVTTLLVAGPIVAAFVPLLAIAAWLIPASPAILALAGLTVAGGVTLAHQEAYPASHQGTFSSTAQVAAALGLAVVLLSAGRRQRGKEASLAEPLEPSPGIRDGEPAPETEKVSEPDEKGSY
jgi:arabinofuranan 3-O-arabinosyltransferase